MRNSVSLEYKLLLLSARTNLSGPHLSEMGVLVKGPLAWDRLLELASWHRLSPLLFFNLERTGLASIVPAPIIQELQKTYYSNAARSLYFQVELGKVIHILQAEGIPTIVLKGAALAETVYKHPALRPMSDLDILVREDHLDRADAIVRNFGYSSGASPEVQRKTREEHRHYPVVSDSDWCVKFEVHRHILRADNPLYFDLAGFWARARPDTIAGAQALALAPEDLLTHLCLNFFLDRYNRSDGALGQVVDISETIRYYQDSLGWDLFTREVRQHRLAGPVYCALDVTRELVGTKPPEYVLASLRPDAFSPAWAQLFIRHRVLGTRLWLVHNLASSPSAYSFWGVLKGAIRRVFPAPSSLVDLAERYDSSTSSKRAFDLYLRRILEVSVPVGRSLLQPRLLQQDLQIDRWMHSLCR